MMIEISTIHELDFIAVQTLVDLSLKEGFNFLDRLVKDWQTGTNCFNLPHEQLYQVKSNGKLIGIGGVNKDPYTAASGIGRIRRFYIHPENRRNGIGRQLIQQIIKDHQDHYKEFRLKTDTEIAAKFYESIGFEKSPQAESHTHQMLLEKTNFPLSPLVKQEQIIYLKGDATVPQAKGVEIIAHICNNIGGWGKGFVLAVSKRWKEPEAAYRLWHRERSKNDFSLGNIQVIKVGKYLHVANMLGQQGIKTGSKGVPIRYEAVESCLEKLSQEAKKINASVHMPRIGCGLAGGKWDRIEPLIQKTLLAENIPTYVYDFG